MPGVSTSNPPPGRRTSSRLTVVWRPLASPERTSPVSRTSSPTRALTSVDLPAPDSPSRATVRPRPNIASTSSRPSRRSGPPMPTIRTGTAGATARTTAATSSATPSATPSALVSTTATSAPLSQATTRKRSRRPGGRGLSRPCTISTRSTLATSTCSTTASEGSRRDTVLARSNTRPIVGPSSGSSTTATQSPVAGATASWARWESERTRIGPSAVTTSHSPRSTRTIRPSRPSDGMGPPDQP